MEAFDVVVVGAGPGGYPAAIRAAQKGASVAIVEKESLGGTCLNWGCIPTKTLIASSSLHNRMKHAGDLGLNAGKVTFDYAAMMKRKADVVGKLKSGVEMLLNANGVKIFHGTASFVDRHRISVQDKQKTTAIEAKSIILATGSVSAVPKFIPQDPRIMESRAFLDMKELPESLLILGGGVIGCEFACMAAQLGVKVTVVEMLEDILFMLDADVRREVRKNMEAHLGITVLTGKPMENIRVEKNMVKGDVQGQTLSAHMLLVSVGRRACTDGLALANAGLETTKTGQLEVNEHCQTRVANIFAIGDVTAGSTQLAHAATAQGITAADNAVGGKFKSQESLVPACIFTDPEIGSVGLTEDKAKAAGRAVTTGKFSFMALGKALASGENSGFVKWVADPATHQLLGAQAVGAHATELISEAAVAIRSELTLEELGNTIHCHPTMSEAWMEAAHAAHGTCIHAPPKRRK
jgi:dihydrolipoamide dehydrogenase